VADLLTRPLLRRDEPAWGSRVPWLAGVLAAAWALVAGLALAVLPGMVVWIDEGVEAPVAEPLRFGGQVWLVAHRVSLQIGASELQLAPWGLSILFLLLLYRAARWAAHSAGVSTMGGAMSVALPASAVYAVGAGVVAGLSSTADVSALPPEAAVWAGLAALVATASGAAHEADLTGAVMDRFPSWTRPVLVGGAVAFAGLYVIGSVLVGVSVVAHSDRISALADALEPGMVGGTLLVLASAAIVPNAALWASAFALGPGFAVGSGTAVGPGGVELGIVPALPALGALPADVPDLAAWLVLLGPIAVGVVTGVVVHRRSSGTPRRVVSHALAAGVVGGVAMAVLALLSGGSAGAARLSVVGPVPWEVALATFLEIGLPAALVAGVLAHRRAEVTDRSGDAATSP
jgi:hypothetical protein